MISDKELPELGNYRRLERQLPIGVDERFGALVAASQNERLPVHRWFRFKEGFSADLLRTVLKAVAAENTGSLRILDPFCGVGTSLLSAQEIARISGVCAVGIERNPLLAFVAQTKLRWPEIDDSKILPLGNSVLEYAATLQPSIPHLSSLTTGRCMSRYISRRLVAIRESIQAHGHEPVHHALLLGVAAVIEQLSRVRKDGRALRIVTRGRHFANRTLIEKWKQIASDIRFMRSTLGRVDIPKVIFGDGRVPTQQGVDPESINLILTSPPYPNNIDYSEVYKLELWLLGFVRRAEEFLGLRRITFRSHPTAAKPDPEPEFLEEVRSGRLKLLLEPLLKRTASSPEKYRYRVILGYAGDMWTSLREQYRCLVPGGRAFVVVGNSLHGGRHIPYLIPTDMIVCAIAERVGFKLDNVVVARALRRRLSSNHFLRESIVALRKPDA